MKILVNVPYYTGSHKTWADNLVRYSNHDIHLLTMKGRHWKWRMEGSAIHLANEFNRLYSSEQLPDYIVCSTMMDVSLYKSLLIENIPILYFIAADHIGFNSHYHLKVFCDALKKLLARLPDYQSIDFSLNNILKKSEVLYIGIEYSKISEILSGLRIEERFLPHLPTILWNHRWNHDKAPELFLKLLYHLKSLDLNFRLVLLGENASFSEQYNAILRDFDGNILHKGYVQDFDHYLSLMAVCDVYPVCSNQDYYGISVLEAICCGLRPLLPQNRVYSEFIDEDSFPQLFYSGESELFSKTESLIKNFSSQNPPNLSYRLEKQDICNVVNKFDLHMTSIYNA